jgi:hypothetical protein
MSIQFSVKLFRITIAANHASFYVVASDETRAAAMIKSKWNDWGYLGDPTATEIELLADAKQYPDGKEGGVTWLLLE